MIDPMLIILVYCAGIIGLVLVGREIYTRVTKFKRKDIKFKKGHYQKF